MTASWSTLSTLRTDRSHRDRPDGSEQPPVLRVVAEPRARHTLAYVMVIVLLLGAAVFGAVALNALAAAESVQARSLAAEVTAGEREYARLIAEVAALEDPGRIRTAALELGMVPAGPARHLQLERNLPADGAIREARAPQIASDLKPVLSAER